MTNLFLLSVPGSVSSSTPEMLSGDCQDQIEVDKEESHFKPLRTIKSFIYRTSTSSVLAVINERLRSEAETILPKAVSGRSGFSRDSERVDSSKSVFRALEGGDGRCRNVHAPRRSVS